MVASAALFGTAYAAPACDKEAKAMMADASQNGEVVNEISQTLVPTIVDNFNNVPPQTNVQAVRAFIGFNAAYPHEDTLVFFQPDCEAIVVTGVPLDKMKWLMVKHPQGLPL